MEAKHTPGPWEWKDDDREQFGHYRLHPGVLATESSDGTPWGDKIDQANARLISAAPELLELIERAHEADCPDEDIRTAWWEARAAAIAKATGSPA